MQEKLEKKEINIDILIAVASHGGVENVVNMLGSFLVRHGFYVRLVQLVYEGEAWADESMEFVHVYNNRNDQNLEHLYEGYKKVLTDNDSKPDVILAVAWPYMSYIAKRAALELELDSVVISYLHAMVEQYENAGFGGTEALTYADLHFAISDNIASDIISRIEGAYVYRVNNPINSNAIVRSEKRDYFKLAYVGRLSKEKRVEVIIKAIAKSKYPYRLFLVGQGPDETQLKELCKKLNVEDSVHFMGWQDRPWETVKDAYACILASAYEGFSLTSIEAMACGKAVIATPVSGVIELVIPGENGFLFSVDDVDGLAKILDAMADGSLPYIEAKDCMESASPYFEEIALGDILLKTYAASKKRLLPFNDVRVPRISVIVSCHNAGNSINHCLDGIISQSIGLSSIEVILVNDGLTDNSLEKIMVYEESFPENIIVINCEERMGDNGFREIGMQYASGEHILFLNADDVLEKKELEDMYILIQTYWLDSVSLKEGRVLYRRQGQ